jgi:polysaccharide biosynthesis protein PelA
LVAVSIGVCDAIPAQPNLKSYAFHYGAEPPLQELRVFDHVILEPDHVKTPPPPLGPGDSLSQSRWLAYVALGEAHRTRDYYPKIPRDWLLGENPAWGSTVLDQTAEAWPDFFLAQVIAPLWKRGYRGFFFDALDSYELHVKSPEGRQRQAEGQVAVIRRIKKAYPDARIILNRGFQILPQVHDAIEAIAFESLFRGWNAAQGQFVEVGEQDRFWLLEKAQEAIKKYNLPVIAIDYAPASDRALMRTTADRIRNVGLIPWVTTPALDELGVGAVEVVPRKILMLYDGVDNLEVDEYSLHRHVDPIVTYLGYVPEHRDIRGLPPKFSTAGRYAGIICWLSPGRKPVNTAMNTWLVAQAAQGMKIAFLGETPFALTGPHADAFGMQTTRASAKDTAVRVIQAEKVMHFEMEPFPDARAFRPLRLKAGKPLLRLANSRADTMVAAAYTPWGGYVMYPFLVRTIPQQMRERWVVQPMEFIAKALNLSDMPAPDVTTENGMRLLMVHVDGDGFANQADWVPHPFAGEVLEKEILTRYPLATTFSIIEAEVSPSGMYPAHSAQLIPIAKRILALPHVEIASHTYSHPFDWTKFARGGTEGRDNHLDIKNFRFGPDLMEREVSGSIDYINRELAPQGKRCKVFLWSGHCNPDARTVGLTYAAGVMNMNGGETLITASSDSWTGIAPIGIDKGGHYQVYAPNQNENMYTHEWTGPFYGYENVIKTFETTDSPIRFKPVDIYYHTYSGSKQASLQALVKIYDWAMGRDLFNVFVSEYAPKVLDFTQAVLARTGNLWVIHTGGSLKQVRIPASMGYPDMRLSRGITGFADVGGVRYIHLSESICHLALSPKPPEQPYLVMANAALTNWQSGARHLSMNLTGHLNLIFSLRRVGGCQVKADGAVLRGTPAEDGTHTYRMPVRQAKIEVDCP